MTTKKKQNREMDRNVRKRCRQTDVTERAAGNNVCPDQGNTKGVTRGPGSRIIMAKYHGYCKETRIGKEQGGGRWRSHLEGEEEPSNSPHTLCVSVVH